MLKSTFRSILPVYSFLGILSIKCDGNKFTTSRFHAVFNLLKMPLVLIFAFFLIRNEGWREEVFRSGYDIQYRGSAFLIFIALVTSEMVQVTSLIICVIFFLRRFKITEFINRASELDIEGKYVEKLTQSWRRNFLLLNCMFWIIAIVQFVTRSQLTLFALVGFSILLHTYIVVPSILSLMKTFETFFLVCLKDFKHRLTVSMEIADFDRKAFHKLIKRYQNIFELNQEFNRLFGAQVTLMTCCVAIMTTFQVSIFTRKIHVN